ncbi:Thiol-disulfide isomerase or thioredoxin [Pustulibacterium marinum]|uniref:Thiol-disulfide isomerase or thioredoxin n=1 Tax=Pustulibacterium marinum TaxID=1224947 RepID=A0A1I7HVM0_9FLAO|nr:TlpA disulfide reductase family protein [Pustulibacterium marinum]SFU64639.1 Thiol-disulfide isomerase or thioredoxin [Pustulibacterium marinum]
MKYFTLFWSLVLLASCSQKSTDGFQIQGEFENGNYNGYVFLNTPNSKDSVLVSNNQFTFNGKVPFPIQSWITLDDKSKLAWLYVENSEIHITFNSPEHLKLTSVTGSESQQKQHHFESFLEDHYNDADFNFRLKDSLSKFITENPSHSLSGKLLAKIASESWILSAEEVTDFKQQLDTSKQTSTDLFVINQSLEKLEKFGIGSTFKDFDLYNLQEETINSSTISAPYLLVDFWASWCVPCRKQNPYIVSVYNKYHSKGFDVLSISLEDEMEPWKKAIAKDNLTWNHLRSGNEFDSPIVSYYEFYSIPYSILIDANRKVVGVNVEPEKIGYFLSQNLK